MTQQESFALFFLLFNQVLHHYMQIQSCCLTRLCCCCLSLSQMSEWIAHSKELFMQSVAEVGQNHQHAVDLQTQHQHFTANCMVSVFVSVSGALLSVS